MNDGLNLLTKEEIFEQKTSVIFKILNIIFGVILFFTVSYSIYSYIEFNKLKEIESSLLVTKNSLLSSISSYSLEESQIREISYRYSIYNKFNNEIDDFSEIIKEIYFRASGTNVEIMTINFDYEEKEVSVRVRSSSEQFTRFVGNIKDTDYKEAETLYPTLFFPSSKNEEVDQAIREYIVYVKYRPEVLRK